MNRRNLIWIALTAIMMTAIFVAFAGCSDKSNNTPQTPPTLPPQSSFLMSFAGFATPSASPATGDDSGHVNFAQSALRVGYWNLILTVTLAVPTAAFIESFNHEPVRQDDGSWAWSYNVTVGVQYTCKLVGSTGNNEILWKMYITKAGAYSDYLWYSGSQNLTGTQGTWTVNRNPDQTNPYLRIDWHHNYTDSTGDLKYTNIIPGDAENGAYIYYGIPASGDYNRFYNIYSHSLDNLAEIEWNNPSFNGRVKDHNFYLDDAWHCWDESQHDITCP